MGLFYLIFIQVLVFWKFCAFESKLMLFLFLNSFGNNLCLQLYLLFSVPLNDLQTQIKVYLFPFSIHYISFFGKEYKYKYMQTGP